MNIVRNHAEVIDTHTVLDNGGSDSTAIDCGICANLYIVADLDRTDLGDFYPALVQSSHSRTRRRRARPPDAVGVRRPTETSCTSVTLATSLE